MPPKLQERLAKAGASIAGMSLGQKVVAVIGIAILALGGTAVAKWISTPTYAPLYSNLAADDASSITGQLTKDGVKYQLADGGATILVPAADVDAERLKSAAAGLPSDDKTGYALLDSESITSSQFQQQVTYQRALEGELEKTIEGISGVDAAIVHLAIPQDTVYTDQAGTPTASVLVDTSGSTTLTDDQVQAIVHLVSSSVPNMSADQVTVSDGKGDLLSAAGSGVTGSSGTTGADARTTTYDQTTAAAVQAMLDKVFGPGKAIASVNADLDFDNTQKTTQTFSYTKGTPPLSSSTDKETYTGDSASQVGGAMGSNGVLGMDSEESGTGTTSSTSGTGTATGAGGYVKESGTSDNAVNKETDTTTVAPGAVSRQSVAVVVDSAAASSVNMTQLASTVANVAGINTARGDTLSVTQQPFSTAAAKSAAAQLAAARAAQAKAAQMSLLKQAAIALGLLLLAVVALVAWRRAAKRRRREAVDIGELERLYAANTPVIGPDGQVLSLGGAQAVPELGPQLVPQPADPAALRRAEMGDLVDAQPAEVAELLRGWLTDTRR